MAPASQYFVRSWEYEFYIQRSELSTQKDIKKLYCTLYRACISRRTSEGIKFS